MYILGICCYYHDASACLLRDGKIIAAAQEERFSRKKHDHGFPKLAVAWCLQEAEITIAQVDHIKKKKKPFLKFERLLSQHLEMFPKSWRTFAKAMPSWFNEKLRVPKLVKKFTGYRGTISFIHHHMTHAASSYLPSPFQEAAVLTVDGVGEWTTTTLGSAKGNDITLIKEIRFPHSIGLLYSTITAYLGFSVNNSEYKVMGLAPYGLMDRAKNPYYAKLRQTIDFKPDGSYRLDMSYFVYHYKEAMPSQKLCDLLGGPITPRGAPMTKRHEDIAAAVQLVTEDALFGMLNHLHSIVPSENVVLAGGVALNSVANGKLLRNTPFKQIWIHPDAGDGGTSIGAALYLYNTILGNPRKYRFQSASLGPGFSDSEITSYLDEHQITYHKFKNDADLIQSTARLIFENNVIGWFQGRMEWGPRALGNRSILSNPCNHQMKEILNLKVKHREKFRPFAPVICAEDAPDYFECDMPVPEPTDYMLMVYPIKKKFRPVIPAVTHVDGSGRLQTIRRNQNERYYDLIKAFGKLSNVPILINTSFNIRGEPIVCTPHDAYRCMMGTGIDCLVMGSFLIWRKENQKDMWDSESLAND